MGQGETAAAGASASSIGAAAGANSAGASSPYGPYAGGYQFPDNAGYASPKGDDFWGQIIKAAGNPDNIVAMGKMLQSTGNMNKIHADAMSKNPDIAQIINTASEKSTPGSVRERPYQGDAGLAAFTPKHAAHFANVLGLPFNPTDLYQG